MKISACLTQLAFITSLMALAGCASQPPSPSPCIVTAPSSVEGMSGNFVEAEGSLTTPGGKTVAAGMTIKNKEEHKQTYQKIPENLVACQMILQLGACLVSKDEKIGDSYTKLVEKIAACTQPDNSPAVVENRVYIQIADKSQGKKGHVLREQLINQGFNTEAIELVSSDQAPNLNEIRYYYNEHFNAAKLIKQTMEKIVGGTIFLNPMYDYVHRPSLEKAPIEIWLAKPKS